MIGRWCMLFLLCVQGLLCAQSPTLRIISRQGVETTAAAVGDVCTVDITIPEHVDARSIAVAGLTQEELLQRQDSMRTSIINGVRTQQRSIGYRIQCETEGRRTIGPARMMTPQGELLSNAVDLTVHAVVASSQQHTVKAFWSVPKKNFYTGQGIPYQLKFLYNDTHIRNIHPAPFSMPDGTLEAQSTVAGVETIQGVTYHTLTWHGIVYPTTKTSFTLPRVTIVYDMPMNQHDDFGWGAMFSLFTSQQAHVIAPALTIVQKELPSHGGPIAGIGSLSRVDLKVSTTTRPAHEPLVVTLAGYGTVEPKSFQAPTLKMADGMQWYPSQFRIKPEGFEQEYVVVASQEGNVTIPEQTITFFDPEKEVYQDVVTQAVSLTITPGKPLQEGVREQDIPEVAAAQRQEVAVHEPSQEPLLPWYWYVCLLLAPVIIRVGSRPARWLQKIVRERRNWNRVVRAVVYAASRQDGYGVYQALERVGTESGMYARMMQHPRARILWEQVEAGAFGKAPCIELHAARELLSLVQKLRK